MDVNADNLIRSEISVKYRRVNDQLLVRRQKMTAIQENGQDPFEVVSSVHIYQRKYVSNLQIKQKNS